MVTAKELRRGLQELRRDPAGMVHSVPSVRATLFALELTPEDIDETDTTLRELEQGCARARIPGQVEDLRGAAARLLATLARMGLTQGAAVDALSAVAELELTQAEIDALR